MQTVYNFKTKWVIILSPPSKANLCTHLTQWSYYRPVDQNLEKL
jgi:hypothetical protein